MGGNRELAERFIATLEARGWDAWAGLLHPAVVYEIPQSRERIRGREHYLRFNQEYPGDWHLRPKVVIADERHGVVWFEWRVDDHSDDAMAFFEFADGLITRVTDFWPEPYEPPAGREHLVERWLPGPRQRSAQSRRQDPGRRQRRRCLRWPLAARRFHKFSTYVLIDARSVPVATPRPARRRGERVAESGRAVGQAGTGSRQEQARGDHNA